MRNQQTLNDEPQSDLSFNKNLNWIVAGLAVGAVSMYFLDPARGRRRRHVFRDQVVSKTNRFLELTDRISKDLSNRTRGALLEMKNRNRFVDDETLEHRVRSQFGRQIRHPRAIHTSVSSGVVTLSGYILREEVKPLIRRVRKVAGVKDVVNHMRVHENAEGISSLQGAGAGYLQ